MNIHISKVEDNIRPEMRHTIEIYDPAMPHEAVTSAWDDTQRYVSGSDLRELRGCAKSRRKVACVWRAF